MRSYRRILEALDAAPGRLDAPPRCAAMREAALKDEAGDGSLARAGPAAGLNALPPLARLVGIF
ncbi:MAG: hypothetical protein WDM92_08190 [Caulobacteraceae bacterium]